MGETADGQEAIRLVEQQEPDLLLIDIVPPQGGAGPNLRSLAGPDWRIDFSPAPLYLLAGRQWPAERSGRVASAAAPTGGRSQRPLQEGRHFISQRRGDGRGAAKFIGGAVLTA